MAMCFGTPLGDGTVVGDPRVVANVTTGPPKREFMVTAEPPRITIVSPCGETRTLALAHARDLLVKLHAALVATGEPLPYLPARSGLQKIKMSRWHW